MRRGFGGGFGLGFLFGGIAIFYGVRALLVGAPLDRVIIQFILGIAMIGGSLYYLLRKQQNVEDCGHRGI